MPRIIVLSLGGSLIVPDSIDTDFLKNFKGLVESYAKKGYRFCIICGGGRLARNLQESASRIKRLNDVELDWLGIHATKLNAELVKSLFGNNAEKSVITNPTRKIRLEKKIAVAAGWMPGRSTDHDAVLLAKNLKVKEVINMSNVDYVYDKDPRKHKNAKKIKKIAWSSFIKLVGTKWKAGMNAPFDPIAAREAQKSKIRVCIVGKDLNNLKKILDGKKFKGTVIE